MNVAPERFPHQDRGVVHPNPLQPVQLPNHRGFPFRLRSKSISTGPRVAGFNNGITLGFHAVDLPHHQRQALQLAHKLTLQVRSEGTPVPGHNRIQAFRRIRGPGIEVHDPLRLQQTFDPVAMTRCSFTKR